MSVVPLLSRDEDARGVNETETYSYSYSQSEKIRQIMAHKDAKLKEEEASEIYKDGSSRPRVFACFGPD
jgi:hypothetical protein